MAPQPASAPAPPTPQPALLIGVTLGLPLTHPGIRRVVGSVALIPLGLWLQRLLRSVVQDGFERAAAEREARRLRSAR